MLIKNQTMHSEKWTLIGTICEWKLEKCKFLGTFRVFKVQMLTLNVKKRTLKRL